MKMSYTTKMRKNKGSMLITIPAGLVELLKIESGDSLRWDADIRDEGVTVTIEPIKAEN